MLYGAFAIHYSLALRALWLRRSLKMPFAEATQLVLGFSIPFFLTDHVLQTRVADTFYGADYGYYSTVLYAYFVANPLRGGLQLTVLVIAWVHAMIGLRFWLRLKPWYERWQPILYAFALLMPTLAILGFFEGGREIMAMAGSGLGRRWSPNHPAPAPADTASSIRWWCGCARVPGRAPCRVGSASCAVALGAQARRHSHDLSERPRGPDRARCVGIGSEPDRRHSARLRVRRPRPLLHLPRQDRGPEGGGPAGRAEEVKVLRRVGAAPNVRLACQLRPHGDLRVTPLLPATAQARDGFRRPGYLQRAEERSQSCSRDLAPSPALRTEAALRPRVPPEPLFSEMGHAVEAAGGRIDKFIGDGVMALFGLDSGVEAGCRQALAAAKGMAERMQNLNRTLVHDISGAAPDRHRYPYRPCHCRRNGLWHGDLDHGRRQRRQHGEPHRKPHQDLHLRAGRLRGRRTPRRHRSRRRPAARD